MTVTWLLHDITGVINSDRVQQPAGNKCQVKTSFQSHYIYKREGKGMKKIKNNLVIVLALITFFLSACGGGGSNPPDNGDSTNTGYFVDSAVSGLSYVTSSGITGVTDAFGAFEYAPGDSVTFSIGDVVIGEATGASLLTPVSLVPGATDETDTTVTNIARFLQSLDEDGNPDNGITIAAGVATAAAGQSLDFSSASFDTDAGMLVEMLRDAAYGAGDTGTLVDAATAQAHLLGSLLCEYSGVFEGTWVQTAGPGSGSGTWTFSTDSDSNITGTATTPDGSVGLSGNVASDGSSVVGNVTDYVTFTGSIGLDGSVSGTWANSQFGTSGTYSGNRTQDASSECDGSSSTPVSSEGGIILSGNDTGVIGTSFTPNTISVESNGYALHWTTVVDDGGNDVVTHSLLAILGFDGSLLSMTFTREVGNDSYVYEMFCNVSGCDSISVNMTTHTVTFTNTVFPVFALGGAATDSITLNGSLSYASVAAELADFTGDPGNVTEGEFGTLTLAGNDASQFGTTFTPDTAYLQNPDRPAWEIISNSRLTWVWVDINADGTAGAVDFRDIDASGDPNAPAYLYQLNCGVPGAPDCTTLAENVVIDLGARTVTFNNVSVPASSFYDGTGPITLNGTLTYTGTLVFP
jgi:hypothetical protein